LFEQCLLFASLSMTCTPNYYNHKHEETHHFATG
jgi:hypothetical protein